MEYQIVGTTLPVLEVTLQPQEWIIAESGELSWMTASIGLQSGLQIGGQAGGLFGAITRAISGSTIFMTQYYAYQQPGQVGFATKVPGTILPIDMPPGHPGYIVHRHGFLAAGGLRHDGDVRFALEQRADSGAHQSGAVRKQDADPRGSLAGGSMGCPPVERDHLAQCSDAVHVCSHPLFLPSLGGVDHSRNDGAHAVRCHRCHRPFASPASVSDQFQLAGSGQRMQGFLASRRASATHPQ